MKLVNVSDEDVVKFMQKIHADPCDIDLFVNTRCGLHSGFPKCCVAFHTNYYLPMWEAVHSLLDETKDGEDYMNLLDTNPMYNALDTIHFRHVEWAEGLMAKMRVKTPCYPCHACLLKGNFATKWAACDCDNIDYEKFDVVHKALLKRLKIITDEDDNEIEQLATA